MFRLIISTSIAVLSTSLLVAVAVASQGPEQRNEPQLAAVIPKSSNETAPPAPGISLAPLTAPPVDPREGIDLSKMRYDKSGYRQIMKDGREIVFTVHPEVQRYADALFEKYQVPAGAAVMLSSRTGRVIAISQTRRVREAAASSSVALDPSPPAASLFKIVTTAALMEKGGVSLGTKTCYAGGGSRLELQHLSNELPKNHACVDLTTALARSVNAVYAKLSDRHLERRTLVEYADRFGFNRLIDFDVPLPKSTAKIPTERLERARTAAGFWHTHLSPLHAAMIAQSLAQGGAMLRPYVVDRVTSRSGEVLYSATTRYLGNAVSKETAEELTKAMLHTTKRGTARHSFQDRRGRAYLPGIDVSGKTGTLNGSKPYRAYTWFVGLAPQDKPEVAIAVLVVNEPEWRIKAPQMAAFLLKKYFEVTR